MAKYENNGLLAEAIRAIRDDVTGIAGAVMRGTDSAALASVVGALADAAAAGDPTASDTMVAYIKQLINTLEGTSGIPVFPAEAAPANNVSLAEVIRAMAVDVTGLAGATMRGTDSAALASVCTEPRLAELDGANLPADIAAIPTTAMRGTDSAALASVATEARLSELDAGKIPSDLDAVLIDTANMQPKLGTIPNLGGGATVGDNLSDIAGSTFNAATDSQEAIRDRGDAEWTTGAGGSDRLLMVDTTIATLASQVSFTLAGGSTDNDAYIGCTIIIEDVSTAVQKAIGLIDTYVGSTKTVTLLEDPGVFTIAATDKVYILAEKGLKPTVAADYHVDVASGGEVGIDWGNIGNPATAVDLENTDIKLVDTVTVNSDMRGTDSAALASVLGALADAAAAGDPTAADTVIAYVKQLINTLEGAAGIPVFPVEGAPANNVSLAEIIRAIHTDVTGLSGASMRGTDSAALASVATEARLAELDAANLPADIAAIPTTAMRGTDSAALASICTEPRLAELDAANLPTDVAARATPAQVNAEVSDVIKVDVIPELPQGVPSATPTLQNAAMLPYMAIRNKLDITSALKEIHDDAGIVITKKVLTDDDTTYSEAKAITGP